MFITHYLGSVIGSVDKIACSRGAADQSNKVINSANEVSNPGPCQVRSHACEGRPGCARSHVMNEICFGLYLEYGTR